MSAAQTKREVDRLLKSGYQHVSREYERQLIKSVLLENDIPEVSEYLPGQFFLHDQPLRSAKNMAVCLVAVICRFAADNGADDRLCYAFSDTYINIIEEKNNMDQILSLFNDILTNYRDLIQQGRKTTYSHPIQRAIRLIDAYLHQPCSLGRIANELNLHPNYLSSLFKKEVGITITQYIRDRKMEEAQELIANTDHSISEIAEMLGYNSLSYFSKVFRQVTQTSPRNFARVGSNQ